jgi:Family of unknown function (DUF6353)
MLKELQAKVTSINSTSLLTGMAVSGVVSTAYLTARATFKAAKIIEQEDRIRVGEEKAVSSRLAQVYRGGSMPMTTKEKIKLVWPYYVAPVGVGATTIAAIVLANHEASKKIAALTAATGVSERMLQEYKEKVLEKLGENKEQQLRDELAQDRVNKNPPPKEVIIATGGDVLFFDVTTGRYFMSSVETVKQAQNKINYDIINHMYASLSSFYDEIGLPPTPFSDQVGWNADNLIEVKFSTVMSTDQRPCISIEFELPPFVEYSRLW